MKVRLARSRGPWRRRPRGWHRARPCASWRGRRSRKPGKRRARRCRGADPPRLRRQEPADPRSERVNVRVSELDGATRSIRVGGRRMNHLLSIEDLDRAAIERHLRPRRRVRGGRRARHQEGARAARAHGPEPLLRGEHAHAPQLRARRQAPQRRRRELRRLRLERREGRVAQGHRADAERPQARRDRHPHAVGGRRRAGPALDARRRSSTPATASTSTRRRRCSTSTRCAAGSAGSTALSIWIVGDVLHSRVARSNILAFQRDGGEGHRRRPADADPARDRGARLRGPLHARRPRARPTSSTRCACSTSA